MTGRAGRVALVMLASVLGGVLAGCATVAPTALHASAPAAQGGPDRPTFTAAPALLPLELHVEPVTAIPESTVTPVVAEPTVDGAGDNAPGGVEFQRGGASWYGTRFQGRRTASGERFDLTDRTAAHRTLPFGTLVCVRSLLNDRQVLVRVNDRGPAARSRVIDLSQAAAEDLAMVGMGVQAVALTRPLPGQPQCQ